MPIAKGDVDEFDDLLVSENSGKTCEMKIRGNRTLFYDDVTLGIFNNGGVLNDKFI